MDFYGKSKKNKRYYYSIHLLEAVNLNKWLRAVERFTAKADISDDIWNFFNYRHCLIIK